MTALGTLLDLPDEPPRQWRGLAASLVGGAVVLVAGVVVARTFALGGWVRPWLAVEAVLALPAMLVVWVLAGPHPQRTWLTTACMVAGLLLQPLAAAGATPSVARLAQIVDSVGLPGEHVRDVRVGNGRCRPACSELRRTSVARGIAYAKARGQVDGALRANGYELKVYGRRAGEPERMDARKGKIFVQIELRQTKLDETRIAQVWITRGPRPSNQVG